jgi:hypothetical protein
MMLPELNRGTDRLVIRVVAVFRLAMIRLMLKRLTKSNR